MEKLKMTVWIKQGVLGDLIPVARKGLGRVAKLYESKGRSLYITSLCEANHSHGSLHYDGRAFDIKGDSSVTLPEIKLALGQGWDVIDELNHIHCEFDPK